MNMQNLPRGGELRKAILAPPDHAVVVVDSAQIEARMLGWLANDQPLLAQFRGEEDVYKHMASKIYDKAVENIDKAERFVGKVAVLGLGYQMGWKKFQDTLVTGAMGQAVDISESEAALVVDAYRSERSAISGLWETARQWIEDMIMHRSTEYACLKINGADKKVMLPNGMYLEYPGLHAASEREFLFFDYENAVKKRMGLQPDYKKSKRLYGGILVENITQALARIVVSDQMRAIAQRYRVVAMTHDEVVAVAPQEEAEEAYQFMLECMRTSPEWCADLPLDAEGGWDYNYSK